MNNLNNLCNKLPALDSFNCDQTKKKIPGAKQNYIYQVQATLDFAWPFLLLKILIIQSFIYPTLTNIMFIDKFSNNKYTISTFYADNIPVNGI